MSEYGDEPELLPDEILAKHLDGGGTATAAPPEPGTESEDFDDLDDADDKPDEGPDAELEEDEDEEEVGDEDPEELDDLDEEDDDQDDDSEEEEEEADEDVEDVFESVSAEEFERIQKDPALRKLYRSMQGDYTRKTKALSETERAVEQRQERVQRFENVLRTPEGMRDYLAGIFETQRDVVGAAFEAVVTGEHAPRVLLEIALHDPKAFEDAYERAQDLQADPDARAKYERDRELEQRELQIQQREIENRRRAFDEDYGRLTTAAEKEARRQGLDPDDLNDVKAALKERIRGHVQKDGRIDLQSSDVRKVVAEVKAAIDKQLQRLQKRVNPNRTKKSQERTKKLAAKAKGPKRVPPKAPARRPPTERKKLEVPEGADPLDFAVDHFIAREP